MQPIYSSTSWCQVLHQMSDQSSYLLRFWLGFFCFGGWVGGRGWGSKGRGGGSVCTRESHQCNGFPCLEKVRGRECSTTALYCGFQPRVKSRKESFRFPDRSKSVESRKINEGETERIPSSQHGLQPLPSCTGVLPELDVMITRMKKSTTSLHYWSNFSSPKIIFSCSHIKYPTLHITLSSRLNYTNLNYCICATRIWSSFPTRYLLRGQ